MIKRWMGRITASFISITMILSGCTGIQQAGGSSAAALSSAASASVASVASVDNTGKAPVVITEFNERNFYDKTGKRYFLKTTCQTLKLDDLSAKTYPALNEALKSLSKDLLDKFNKKVDSEKDSPDIPPITNENMYYQDLYALNVVPTDHRYLSIMSLNQSYLGGPHPEYYTGGYVYDVNSGNRLKLSDVFKSREEFAGKVKDKLKEMYPDVEFTDLDKLIKELADNSGKDPEWYLTPNYVVVVFNPGVIAPYAAGTLPVGFDYDKDKDLLKEGFSKFTGGYASDVNINAINEVYLDDLGGGHVLDIEPKSDGITDYYVGLSVKFDSKSYDLSDLEFYNFYAKFVHLGDNKNYIYIYTQGLSDYEELQVFEIKGDGVDYCGKVVAGEPRVYKTDANGERLSQIENNEFKYSYELYSMTYPDIVYLQQRVDALSTYYIKQPYKINDKGIPEATDKFGDALDIIRLTAKKDIKAKTVDITSNELKDDTEIKKGEKITIYRTNGTDTVIFTKEDGSYVGLKFEAGNKVEGLPVEDLFDNLRFAG